MLANESSINQIEVFQNNSGKERSSSRLKIIGLLVLTAVTMFIAGLGVGMSQSKTGSSDIIVSPIPSNTPSTTNVTPSATNVTPSPTYSLSPSPTVTAELSEATLVDTTSWKTLKFPKKIYPFEGENEFEIVNLEFKIPQDWSVEVIGLNDQEANRCSDYKISNQNETAKITISCSSGLDYLPISGKIQIVKLRTSVGNDGHDSYIVRYQGQTNKSNNYGSIGVLSGVSIDISQNLLYPHLVIGFEPDIPDYWLWATVDLTLLGEENLAEQIQIADTIVATLKLSN